MEEIYYEDYELRKSKEENFGFFVIKWSFYWEGLGYEIFFFVV